MMPVLFLLFLFLFGENSFPGFHHLRSKKLKAKRNKLPDDLGDSNIILSPLVFVEYESAKLLLLKQCGGTTPSMRAIPLGMEQQKAASLSQTVVTANGHR